MSARVPPLAPPSQARILSALVARGLVEHSRTPLTWGAPLGAMSALIVAIWPSLEDSIAQLVESYPAGLREAFGIGTLATVEQFYEAEMLNLIVPLAMAVLGVRAVTRATVAAEERGHLDTLLSLPVSRRTIAAAAFITASLAVLGVLAAVWALTWAAGTIAGTGISAGTLAAGLLNVWPLSIAFAGLAVLIAGLAHRSGPVTAVASATLVGMYVLDLVGRLADGAEPLRAVSAFRYHGSAIQDGLSAGNMALLAGAGLLLAAVGAWRFERRDILG